MARLNKAERANIRAAIDELQGYAYELREKSVGMDDYDLRATQLQDQARSIDEIGAELDEMLYRASA